MNVLIGFEFSFELNLMFNHALMRITECTLSNSPDVDRITSFHSINQYKITFIDYYFHRSIYLSTCLYSIYACGYRYLIPRIWQRWAQLNSLIYVLYSNVWICGYKLPFSPVTIERAVWQGLRIFFEVKLPNCFYSNVRSSSIKHVRRFIVEKCKLHCCGKGWCLEKKLTKRHNCNNKKSVCILSTNLSCFGLQNFIIRHTHIYSNHLHKLIYCEPLSYTYRWLHKWIQFSK